ncbi:MAG: HAD hydrolase family protein [Eubacteriales bacterium]|nr:HAD hydrolase family protein [Eubacteriales bacterium]
MGSESAFAIRAIGADRYLIASNGQSVYRDYEKKEFMYSVEMEEEIAKKVYRLLYEEGVFFQMHVGDIAYVTKDREEKMETCGWTKEYVTFFQKYMQVEENLWEYLQKKNAMPGKFLAVISEKEKRDKIRARAEQIEGVVVLSTEGPAMEILPKNVDKRRGVQAVAAAAGLSKEQIMVIGDSENDMGMFDEAGIRVAMGNACPQLKAKAHYQAPSNVEDGVAWALETLLLKEREMPVHSQVQYIDHESIEKALESSRRQYLTGDLEMPQVLPYIRDSQVECGISDYSSYHWETAHYHTTTTEYGYMISGETKYVDLSSDIEYHFREGDFYMLRKNTPYLQKSQPGCRLLFFKVPGINDKQCVESTEKMNRWCENWEIPWKKDEDEK